MNQKEPLYRHELKYAISTAQLNILKSRIENIMHLDSHVGKEGMYNIRSLYFDDYRNSCYYENENGTDPREKFRIRIYNHSSQRITLECKRKERGKTLKSSCPLDVQETEALMRGEFLEFREDKSALYNKMALAMRSKLLLPKVIVEYERIPYVYKNGNVRVTFDMNIMSSSDVAGFFNEDITKRPIMPLGQHLMEVKFDEYLPDFIYRSLNLNLLQQTAYSKYYLSRKFKIHK